MSKSSAESVNAHLERALAQIEVELHEDALNTVLRLLPQLVDLVTSGKTQLVAGDQEGL